MAAVVEAESLSERQENELQVLKAIYLDDVKDLRENDAWKVTRPPEISIKLQPQESMDAHEVYSSVELYIKCSATYPEMVPVIELNDPKDISNMKIGVLKNELKTRAKELVGEVMILELAQHVQTFLHANKKPPTKSLHEEMMTSKKRQEELLAKEQQEYQARIKQNEEIKQRKITEEILRRQEALKEESRRIRQEAKQSGLDRISSSDPSNGSDPLSSGAPIHKDTAQRKRASVTPERLISESGSYQKNERRKRNTSTPKRRDSETDGDSIKCNDHNGVCVLEFTTKTPRLVHRGRCLVSAQKVQRKQLTRVVITTMERPHSEKLETKDGPCIGHSLRGCTTYAGMDTKTGELVAITEWHLQWHKTKRKLDVEDHDVEDHQKENDQTASYCKQVSGIESEFMSLLRLSHRNLLHYLAFKQTLNPGSVTVHVLSEFISGGSLKSVISGRMPVPIEHLRLYSVQLVDVLDYLHGKAVVHKNLRLSSVVLETNGLIHLGDFSIDHRLAELYAALEAKRPGVHFADDRPIVPGKGRKKADIYMLGVMLLSLAQGEIVSDENFKIPTWLPEELSDFLNKCLVRDERSRWSATQLKDHTFIKSPIHQTLKESKSDQKVDRQKDVDDGDEDGVLGLIPYIPSSEGGQSRLKNEFEITGWLGKGGFGDVIKVRNKLDGRDYAIKRIPLNPRSKQFTKKITREVKLLSRLNHENVVRYYNSWIEVSEDPVPSECTNSTLDTPETASPMQPQVPAKFPTLSKIQGDPRNSLGLKDDLDFNADLVPAATGNSTDWSVSFSGSLHINKDDSSSDDEEDDDDDDDEVNGDVFGMSFGASFLNCSDSDSIVFDYEDQSNGGVLKMESEVQDNVSSMKEEEEEQGSTVIEPAVPLKLQFLYIQMEFCDKSTLRDCIDADLYHDRDRVWRLFREICEGLHHIHLQGMIHRDLKPVNIFLDCDDQVKIGDFGLATKSIVSQQQTGLMDLNMTPAFELDPMLSTSKSESLGDGNLTGKVGTALYVSPEMINTSTRTKYNQKVDIYSLGVIFFEMCYRPLSTGMERVQVLTDVRDSSITLPEDFDPENKMENEFKILKWLLSHEPAERPTVEVLLSSDLLPPPQLEEAELTELLRSTLAQPGNKACRQMMSAIFSRTVDPATDFHFDSDLHKAAFSPDTLLVQRSVMESLERMFEKRGALRVQTPLLMPKSVLYESCDQYVRMMDSNGGLVALPFDLRVPFARYVAKTNITNLRRFAIEKVYRQKRHFSLHPKEVIECAFDIVTPSISNQLQAEVLHLISDIIKEFPVLQERRYYLRINHASLLRGVLLYCGVPDELSNPVCNILSEVRAERHQKLQVGSRLSTLSLPDNVITNLYRFIEAEGPFGNVSSMLRCITKTRGIAANAAKEGLNEMKDILNHAEALGCKFQPVLAIGLVCNVHYYSGFVFQIVASTHRKNRTVIEILAAGGRYDKLIAKFHKGTPPSAVGVSFGFERLVAARQEQEEWKSRGMVDVIVASLDHKPLNKGKLSTVSELLNAGLRTYVIYDSKQSLEEVQEVARQMGASQIVLLKDHDTARVRTLVDKDKITEKKVQLNELVKFVQQKVAAFKCETPENSNTESVAEPRNCGPTTSSSGTGSSSLPPLNITLVTTEKKIASNSKRRYEAQIYNNITTVMSVISNKVRVDVVGVELTSAVLIPIAANIKVNQDESEFEQSINSIMDRHARRDDKKYLARIFEEIHKLKFNNDSKQTVIIIYGLKDDSYHLLF